MILATLLVLCTIGLPGQVTAADSPDDLNLAQKLIFLGDHLQGIPEGQTIVYDFMRRKTGEPDHSDKVSMTVTKVRADKLRDLSFEFLSGEDRLPFTPAKGYRGNPVAIQFLERDIRDMAVATGRSTAYFRNRIRMAFDDPQIENTRVALQDATVDAVEIAVVPFEKDPEVSAIDGYANKRYRFVYSDQISGGLVSVQTRMSIGTGNVLEEELRYRRMTADAR